MPPDQMRQLYELSKSQLKIWKTFENGSHNDTVAEPGYFEEIGKFLMKHVLKGP